MMTTPADGERILAVVCDLDGTLLDTLEDLADSANSVLAERGFPVHAVDAYRYFVGDGVATLIHRILPESDRTPALEAECVARFKAAYAVRWNMKTHPYPGILDMLRDLAALRIPLAVLSNKPHEATEQCVRELLPGIPFAAVMGQRPGIPKKPDPGAALAIAETLGVPPAQVLYLGDTATDMQTAVASSMVAVGVLWGFRTADELRSNGARVLVQHPQEVVALATRGRVAG